MHYFDNAATTFPKPDAVYDNMDSFYRTYGVNVGRGQFREASVASQMVDETRKLILELFHASNLYSCVFTSSATEALLTFFSTISATRFSAISLTIILAFSKV